MIRRSGLACATLFALAALTPLQARAQAMPDPRQMSGVPLTLSNSPVGSVTVRVVRGSLGNNLAGQTVELTVDGSVRQQKTDQAGRAEFTGLRPGTRAKASTLVGEERLESQEFVVPSAGGVRLLLVAAASAGDPAAGTRQQGSAASQGTVVLGEQSRVVFEIGDDALNVFNIMQIVNTGSTPVAAPQPVVFEAAPNGGTVTLLNGSSPRAAAEGRRIVVAGPFPPGPTLVQFAYSVPYSGPELTIEQRLPIAMNQVIVMAQKVGDMRLASPQIAQHREVAAQGETYIVGQGPGVGAGGVLSFSFSALPHAPAWPRNVALGLAALILGAGAWASVAVRSPRVEVDRAALEGRRDRLFSELTALEAQRRERPGDPAYQSARRRKLITELESIYAALDH